MSGKVHHAQTDARTETSEEKKKFQNDEETRISNPIRDFTNQEFGIYESAQPGRVIIFDIDSLKKYDQNYNQIFGGEEGVKYFRAAFRDLKMNVEVYSKKNTREDIIGYLKKCNADIAEYSAFVCVFLYHGDNTEMATETGAIKIKEIIKLVNDFESLEHKPKIFIFQACRSTKKTVVTDCYRGPNEKMQNPENPPLNISVKAHFADCLIIQSTHPVPNEPEYKIIPNNSVEAGTKMVEISRETSYEDFETNECFVKNFCQALKDYGSEEICNLLTRVNYFMCHREAKPGKMSISSFTSTLTKALYLTKENSSKPDFSSNIQSDTKVATVTSSNAVDSHDLQFYKLRTTTPGKVALMNWRTFDKYESEKDPTRFGSEFDVTLLTETFRDMGMIIEEKHNLNEDDTKQYLKKCANENYDQYAMFVCVVMSHGNEYVIETSDRKTIAIIEIIQTIEESPNLKNKPKIFIFQSCRGNERNKKIVKYGMEAEVYEDDEPTNKIHFADCLIIHSTTADYVAHRDEENGSLFIQELCKAIKNYSKEDEICRLLTKVNCEMSWKNISTEHKDKEKGLVSVTKQMSSFSSMLTKKLYLTEEALTKNVEKQKESDDTNASLDKAIKKKPDIVEAVKGLAISQ